MIKDRNFYRRIGERGGRAGKWSARKRESARYAANVRWARAREISRATRSIRES